MYANPETLWQYRLGFRRGSSMWLVLAQSFEVDISHMIAAGAALGWGVIQYLTKRELERIDTRLDGMEKGVNGLTVAQAKADQRQDDHGRRIDRLETRK